jgi:hypothetical protein
MVLESLLLRRLRQKEHLSPGPACSVRPYLLKEKERKDIFIERQYTYLS